jgi:hypothetical protein
MSEQNSLDNMLDTIAGVLLRCFVIGIVILTIWVVLVMGIPDWTWQMHGELFDLSREQVALAQYAGMLMAKVAIFWLFLFPYIGIKLMLGKKDKKPSTR